MLCRVDPVVQSLFRRSQARTIEDSKQMTRVGVRVHVFVVSRTYGFAFVIVFLMLVPITCAPIPLIFRCLLTNIYAAQMSRLSASLTATLEYASQEKRQALAALGKNFGCHTCGTRAPATYIADHMPPLKTVKLVSDGPRCSLEHKFSFSRSKSFCVVLGRESC